jgi:hypothetical protein
MCSRVCMACPCHAVCSSPGLAWGGSSHLLPARAAQYDGTMSRRKEAAELRTSLVTWTLAGSSVSPATSQFAYWRGLWSE